MIIRETRNQNEIKDILFHPEIYPIISGGKVLDKGAAILPMKDIIYLAGYEEKIFAVGCFHPFMDGMKYHPNILPDYKREYARDFVQSTLNMVKSPLYIEIPKDRKDLYNFSTKMGFKEFKHNRQTDRILMRLL